MGNRGGGSHLLKMSSVCSFNYFCQTDDNFSDLLLVFVFLHSTYCTLSLQESELGDRYIQKYPVLLTNY